MNLFAQRLRSKKNRKLKEEFQNSTNKKKVVEGFIDLSSITNFFKKIKDSFSKIINVLSDIGKFFVNVLTGFVKMAMKIAQFIFKFIFEILPKAISTLFNFLKNLFIKFYQVGLFCVNYPEKELKRRHF